MMKTLLNSLIVSYQLKNNFDRSDDVLHIALVINNAKERILFNEIIDEVFQKYFLGDIVYNRFSTLDDLLQSNDCFDILILDVEQQDSWDNKVLKLYHHNLMKSFYLITNDFEDIQKAFHLNALQVFLNHLIQQILEQILDIV